ncbi:DUF4783 domain-containing protein [Bacteroides sp. OttesenSCG-928-E20]|nr:DUF4783 domain-containing protein [Bacteroides sp. OttesenSCG-928-N06]MDL2299845.1 DUF4783 domain-containing protein [Bacteroides sp. OttesenSCG-928-E20]MDL2305744.1 DUF4783 domain-containing protein [Bacteroides sp. OttesenSCG-928-D19]
MEKRILLYIIGLFFVSVSVLAQDRPLEVIAAFKKGNATELSTYFGERMDLAIVTRSRNVDRQTARDMLNNFFSTNKVKDFTVNHEGKRDDSSFFVGTLTTDNGSFRINCFFKRIQNKYLIHQIRVDKANE